MSTLEKIRADLADSATLFPGGEPVMWGAMGPGTFMTLLGEGQSLSALPNGTKAVMVGDVPIVIDLFCAEGLLRIVRGPGLTDEREGYEHIAV